MEILEKTDWERVIEWANSNEDCSCLDGDEETFNQCCGKKYDIKNPMSIVLNHALNMKDKSPRLKDMETEQFRKLFLDSIILK